MNLISTLKHSLLTALLAGLSGLVAGYWLGLKKVNLFDSLSLPKSMSELNLRKKLSSKSEESLNSKALQRRQVLVSLEKAFRVSKSDLEAICIAFIEELELGLERSRCELKPEESNLPASTLPMLSSYVDRLPTGNESGVFLAVDFGGTHVRIIKVVVDESPVMVEKKPGTGPSSNLPSKFRLIQSKMIVPDELKHGSGYDLFNYIADGVVAFLKQHPVSCQQQPKSHATMKQHRRTDSSSSSKLKYLSRDLPSSSDSESSHEGSSATIPLGFTFSFAVKQNAIDSGTIINWNKDFKCDDVVGCDPVKLLQNALANKGVQNIKVAALVNDTVGTLVAHAYEHPQTMIGLILGTGANACYIEKIDRIKKLKPSAKLAHSTHMLMNTEFGAFNPDLEASRAATTGRKKVLPRTRFDEVVDQASRNPGSQVYEKMISGHYLGEIVRTVLMELVEAGKLFTEATWKQASPAEDKYGILGKRHSFDTSYMSRIERDHSSELADTKSVFEDIFDIYDTSVSDRQVVKFVCELVAIRSARLAAATIAGMVSHLGLARLLYHVRAAKAASQPTTPSGSNPTVSLAPSYTASSGSINAAASALLLSQPSNDNVVVAIDGSLFELYPHYGNRMMDSLRELFGSRADAIQLSLARDGSGLGAALIAAIASDRSLLTEESTSSDSLSSYLHQSSTVEETLAC